MTDNADKPSDADWKAKVLGKMPKAVVFASELEEEGTADSVSVLSIAFSVIPGQPSITMEFEDQEITVTMSTAALIGLDSMIPCGLNYTVIMTSVKKLDASAAARVIASALNKVDATHLIEAQAVDVEAITFRIQLDNQPEHRDGVYCYHAVATIEVDQDVIDKTLMLLHNQIRAYGQLVSRTNNATKH